MMKTGNLLVTTYNYEPDEYCVKPPMLIWFMSLSLKIFGSNEIGVRMPSALAGLFTCMMLFIFCKKYLKSDVIGFFSVMVLITINGYVNRHVTRTGDYDALLTLFTTAYCLFYFAFLETKDKKLLLAFFVSLTCAVLTKSVSGLFFGPALLIYTIYRRAFWDVLKNPVFWGGLIFFILSVGSYYYFREQAAPGYLELVWLYELGGRYNRTLGNHEGDYWFYYRNLFRYRLPMWFAILPLGFAAGLLSKNEKIKGLSLFLGICIISYFLIISGASTKLEWYDAPMFPFIAILCALFLFEVFNFFIKTNFFQNIKSPLPAFLLFCIIAFTIPYSRVISKTYRPSEYEWEAEFYNVSYWLRAANEGRRDFNNHILVYDLYNGHLEFYVNSLQDQGVNFKEKNFLQVSTGDTIILSEWSTYAQIEKRFNFEVLEREENVFRMVLLERKTLKAKTTIEIPIRRSGGMTTNHHSD